jgi:hypothetical protein
MSNLAGLDLTKVTVTVTCRKPDNTPCAAFDADAKSGGVAIVRVQYAYKWITPVFNLIGASSTLGMQQTIEMRIE